MNIVGLIVVFGAGVCPSQLSGCPGCSLNARDAVWMLETQSGCSRPVWMLGYLLRPGLSHRLFSSAPGLFDPSRRFWQSTFIIVFQLLFVFFSSLPSCHYSLPSCYLVRCLEFVMYAVVERSESARYSLAVEMSESAYQWSLMLPAFRTYDTTRLYGDG